MNRNHALIASLGVAAAMLAGVGAAARPAPTCDPPASADGDTVTLRLRAEDGHVVAELVGPEGSLHSLRAARIELCGVDGQLSGSLQVEGDGMFKVEPAPEPAPEPRVQIGVTVEAVAEPLAAQLAIEPARAMLVTGVTEGLPAQRAGLLRYDVITHVDDQEVSPEQLRTTVEHCSAGQPLRLRVYRRGEPLEIVVTAEPYDVARQNSAAWWLSTQAQVTDRTLEYLVRRPALIETQPLVLEDLPIASYRDFLVYQPKPLPAIALANAVSGTGAGTTDDCPVARLRAELESLKTQIRTIESLLDELDDE